MNEVRTRQDVWELGDEKDPWRDPTLLAYAQGVGAMQEVAQREPGNGANWTNQAAIHERRGSKVPGRLEDQCQHATWFFLPWHRMYLYWFEQIVRSHIDADYGDWALPYWNYSASEAKRSLPPAFREQQLPDGGPNPLYVEERQKTSRRDINGGDPMTEAAVETAEAMAQAVFSRTSPGSTGGFGGSETDPLFHHPATGEGVGVLEEVPHGSVHVEVGGRNGFMSYFSTAALDPIFWLHHANLDRLWEEWRRTAGSGHPAGVNPTASDWLDMRFEFVNPQDGRPKMAVRDVLDIEAQLRYTYSDLPAAEAPAPEPGSPRSLAKMADEGNPEHPPELVGASEGPLTLAGRTTAASVPVSPPSGPASRALSEQEGPAATYLNIENIRGEAVPGVLYGVYLNLPEGEPAEPDSPSYVGAISLFGIEATQPDDEKEEAPHGLHYTFDISGKLAGLREQGRWNPERFEVTFSPVGVDAEAEGELDVPSVEVGRVSVFVE